MGQYNKDLWERFRNRERKRPMKWKRNLQWTYAMTDLLERKVPFEYTTGYLPKKQWLWHCLWKMNIPHEVIRNPKSVTFLIRLK